MRFGHNNCYHNVRITFNNQLKIKYKILPTKSLTKQQHKNQDRKMQSHPPANRRTLFPSAPINIQNP